MEKQPTPIIAMIFYVFGGIFLIISLFMLITAIGYTKTYLQSYDASFGDMWSHSLQYIIAQFGPYLGFGIVCLGIGKAIKEMKYAVANQDVAIRAFSLNAVKANTKATTDSAKANNSMTSNDLADKVSFLAEQIEATREVLGIKIEEKEKRDAYRLEELGKKISFAKENPASEEISAPGETPVAEETPVSEETPVAEETPASEETPVAEETPASEETLAVEETPTFEETPVTEELPVSKETLAVEETSATEEAPTSKDAPARIAFPAKAPSSVPETTSQAGTITMLEIQEVEDTEALSGVPQIMSHSGMMAMPEIPTTITAAVNTDEGNTTADIPAETMNFDAFASKKSKRDTFSRNELEKALAREEALRELEEAKKEAEQEKK